MGILSVFGKHRSLAFELTQREVLGRYRGASFGLLWSLISPFLMLLVYTMAFGYIMKGRWPGSTGSTTDFALILFAGLTVHGFFAECFTRAPQLIVANTGYVKRVVFPLDLLVWSMAFSALFHLLMNMVVLLILHLCVKGSIPPTAVLLPVVVLPLVILTVGVGWIVSALGVYLRDIGQIAGVVATAMLFLSSAIVPLDSVPASYRIVFELNPLTFIINQVREVVIWGRLPDWTGLAIYTVIACVVAVIGHRLFNKLRVGFADVL
ncbi:ABC transporter permease [Stenotrophomonas sp. C960]|jgi:lipopolysaccharide transport system permease protein|uniref:ABC transporter permease n=1 Tax=unclassified Stenotrophomonas TaxID=196198 RepID=UPI000E9BFD37|nr:MULTISPECIES: ABC transporter permease [Stenotrophomonas]MBN4971738.1 ABC transporter permease [Stenotrophomonas maltophilia]MDV3465515.1 ABC transporter permease [Stenotrophomonas sp. C960]MDV3530577.1 ABC transporter permease [Stenotrophomonas sp. C2866]HAQ74828.1 sugar ABC transporter permease [Pseudomonas sp.]